jgi:hypothetical protein
VPWPDGLAIRPAVLLAGTIMSFTELASYWASRGYRVLPLRPLDPENGGKAAYYGFQFHATTDPERIAKLAKKHSESCGVGICTTGLLAIDVDGSEGHAVIEEFERHGCHFPETMIFRSPVDPLHYKLLYRCPEGVEFKQMCGWKADGVTKTKIDLKAWHCLVVAGGSVHKSGLPTITEHEMPLKALPLAPEWLVNLLTAQRRVKTQAELKATERPERHTEWRDSDGFSIKPYVEMAVAQFPTSVGHRHDPTIRLIGKLCCSQLSDTQIMEVGRLWLRHYEGQYGLTFEQALARFQTILNSTRSNPKFVPYTFDILAVALPPPVLAFLDEIEEAEGRPSRILVEVVMREWILELEKKNQNPPHHFTLDGVEEENALLSIPIALTWKQVKDGYRLLSQTGIDDHKFLDLKAKYFSLPDWGENGTRAKRLELFIRTSKGSPGRPSIYEPSQWLVHRLSQKDVPNHTKTIRTETVRSDAGQNDDLKKALFASKSGYYKTAYYKKFVKEVKERDNYTCQACGTHFNQPSMQVVCIKGVVSRVRNAEDYVCACKKCATLHAAINRGDDLAVSKYKPERIEQVIKAWHQDLWEVRNGLDAAAKTAGE